MMRTINMKTLSTLAATFVLGAALSGCSQETQENVEHTAKDSYENVQEGVDAFGTEMESMGDNIESKATEYGDKAAAYGDAAAGEFNQGVDNMKDSSRAAMEDIQKKANDMTPDEG